MSSLIPGIFEVIISLVRSEVIIYPTVAALLAATIFVGIEAIKGRG